MRNRNVFLIVAALNVVMVSAVTAAPRDDAAPGTHAVEIFHGDFGDASDANYDLWPDGWTRLRGPGYPQYIKIGIDDQGPAEGQRSLKVKLDGGAALVSTPVTPVGHRFSYVAEAKLRTNGLKYDVASLKLVFLDQQRQILQEIESEPLRGTTGWTAVRIGPVAPGSDKTRFAVLSLHVRPDENEDLRGEAFLSDVRLSRLPRMTLKAGGLKHLYFVGEPVEVTTDISGMSIHDNQVIFQLLDPYGKVVAEQTQTLKTEPLPPVAGDTKASLAATGSWRPPIDGPGFYRVQVSMVGDDGLLLKRVVSLVVIESQPSPSGGEFGWTLPDGEEPLDFAPLTTLLPQAGVNWIKFPTWYDESNHVRADRLAWFAERLSINGIEMVGLLDHPPPGLAKMFGTTERMPIALVFSDRDIWQPAIDPVMMRLSLKVHWWQLGADDDLSYVGFGDLAGKIGELKQSFDRYGQEVKLGVVWQSEKAPPKAESAAWEVLSYADESSLTAAEITQQFGGPEAKVGRRWLTLRPLASSEYDVQTRVSDLVQRMIAAKASAIDTAFVPRPFDDERGLFATDGTPGELFLPWRATALAISGRDHLGTLRLPRGSTNHVFAGENDAVMVLWNDRAVREHAFLGEAVQRLDLWGRRSPLPVEEIDGIRQQVIEVGPEPIILSGLNPQIVRWCMSFEFEKPQLESLFGREQAVAYHFRNTFDKGVGGELSFTSPDLWEISPPVQRFRLAPGEEKKDTFPLLLKPDADSGAQPVRIDFTVNSTEEFRFSIHRTLTVGLDEIAVDLESRLEESGELVVKAHVTNHTRQPVSFRATLFAPDRRREQRQLLYLGPERTTTTFRLPRGEELLGKDLRLQLEELSGSRVLNQHIQAQK